MNVFQLDDARRATLLANAKHIAIARADFLYMPGDDANSVFVVESGRVKIVRTTANGSESIIGIRNPGDLFGELTWMSDGAKRTSSAVALDEGVVVRIDAALFERRLRDDVVVSAAFARGMSLRLAIVERELTELAGKSVPGRLVDALGRLAADHGVREADGTLRIALSLTHKDLADIIGTSRETLTKELSVLADVGLLRVSHREIVLVQPQAFPFARRGTSGS